MIILFTSNIVGGVLQFVIQILYELKEMNIDVEAFIPEGAIVHVDKALKNYVVEYKKVKTLNTKETRVKAIANQILEFSPELVWYFDNSILTSEVGSLLDKKVKQLLIMHDAGGYHPSNIKGLKAKLHKFIERHMSGSFEKRVDNILLLSDESKRTYENNNPKLRNKTLQLHLGAHAPNVEGIKPVEMIPDEYLLFFGRIDKYKGLENLFNAYFNYSGRFRLVVAGNGKMTEAEEFYVLKDKRIITINRYISDEEMVWLFKGAVALILPYIEATQSGIIPIAYRYAKPVIVSNIEGLTQFVTKNVTGYICDGKEDYIKAISLLEDDHNRKKMGISCQKYYCEHLNWENNLKTLIKEIGI